MPAPSPTTRSPHRPAISAEAARRDRVDTDQFEKKARELAVPTPFRPALVAPAEVAEWRTKYTTGSGRLDALTKTANARDAFYRESVGLENFDPLSDAQRAQAQAFFAAHPPVVEPAPGAAPDEPAPVAADPARRPPAAPVARTQPPYCSLAIRFLATNGLACELTVYGVTAADALDRGRDAMKRLVEAGVKPIGAGG